MDPVDDGQAGLFPDEPPPRKRRRTSRAKAEEARRRRRGRERLNIRRATFGGPQLKLMLWTLDDHCGSKGHWTLTFAELAREMEIHRTTAYALAKRLAAAGLISFEPASDDAYDFTIHHVNVPDFIRAEARRPRRKRGRPPKKSVVSDESISCETTTFSSDAKIFSPTRNVLASDDVAPLIESAQERPPQRSAAADSGAQCAAPAVEWEEVEEALSGYGVRDLSGTIAKIQCRPEVALRAIEFAASKPGAWPPKALVFRLSQLRNYQDPTDGALWPPVAEEYTHRMRAERERADAAARLARAAADPALQAARAERERAEAAFREACARFDAMSDAEREALAESLAGHERELYRRGGAELRRTILVKALTAQAATAAATGVS